MRRAAHAMLAALLLVVVLAAPAIASPPTIEERRFTVALSGANEVPPADPDGTGTARIFLHQGRGQVCFIIQVSNIGPVVADHIHPGVAGVNGPAVVDFGGSLSGCVSGVDPALIGDIIANPSAYYINVHTAEFPGGAVRGQLG
jgi:hypothetical protein